MTECKPAGSVAIENDAVLLPATKVPLPSGIPSAKNVTQPAGVPELEVTEPVSVTDWPSVMDEQVAPTPTEQYTVVVVAAS